MFENNRKRSHSTLRAKRATFTFWVDKRSSKMPKMSNLASFWKPKACGQTVLPDRSILMGQKLVENAKMSNFRPVRMQHVFRLIFRDEQWALLCICMYTRLLGNLEWATYFMNETSVVQTTLRLDHTINVWSRVWILHITGSMDPLQITISVKARLSWTNFDGTVPCYVPSWLQPWLVVA